MSKLSVKYGTAEEVNLGKATGITAFAGGGQTGATAITKKWNEVTTCASDYDSVKLLAGITGSKQVVYNNTAKILCVFPMETEKINGITNMKFGIDVGQVMTFECFKDGLWFSYGMTIDTIT